VRNIFSKYLKVPDPEKAHAEFSASGSERWLGCPASVRLSKGIPSTTSEASARGTNTHTLLQFMLENVNWKGHLDTPEAKAFKTFIGYDAAMQANALFAARYVWEKMNEIEMRSGVRPKLYTEQKLELRGVGFGTSDVILHSPFGELHVMDYKNGTKMVEPEGNTQGLYYACGAAFKFNWEFSDIHITIIQPNTPHTKGQVRTWTTTHDALDRAYTQFLNGVRRARKPDAPVVKNDGWCWFCPARIKCPAHIDLRHKKTLKLFGIEAET